MFQYTKENILNSIPKIYASNGKINIEGLGEYVLENIVDKTVYVTPGTEGVKAIKKYNLGTLEAGKEYILTFRVITPDQYLAEYASPNWQVFGKPIMVGFKYTDATKLAEAIALAVPEGNKFFSASVDGTTLTLNATSFYMDFDKVAIEDVATETTTILTEADGGTPRKAPFATKDWIIENLRFPTYPNIRYASASTMPTADVYTEYAFTYRVPRVGLGGLSGVGQALDAVTRHIFYVPSNLAANFEKGLAGLNFDRLAGKGAGTDGTLVEGGNAEEITEDNHKEVDTTVGE